MLYCLKWSVISNLWKLKKLILYHGSHFLVTELKVTKGNFSSAVPLCILSTLPKKTHFRLSDFLFD